MLRRMVVIGLVAMGVTAWAAESSPPPSKPRGPKASRSWLSAHQRLEALLRSLRRRWARSKTAPLLLIPGAFLSTDSMKPWVAAFAAKRAVIVFDQQGHGRTADTSRKMSYEQFGDDAAALLRALKVERADVMGYSQGGGVALQLALRHPTLVNKLVSLSATYRKDGWYPAVPKAIAGLNAKVFAGSPVEARVQEAHARSQGVRGLHREDEGVERQRPEHHRRSDARHFSQDDGHRRRCGWREAGTRGGDVQAAGRRR